MIGSGGPRVSQTSKNACPKCRTKFRTGGLLPMAEEQRLRKTGIINLGEPPDRIDCPKCQSKLKVVEVRMGTFFTVE